MVFQRGNVTEEENYGGSVLEIYTGFESNTYTSSSSVPWYSNRTSIKTIIFKDEIIPVSTAYWFYSCSNLTSITDLEKLNTDKVTDMSYMFSGCSSLESLTFGSNFNTSEVTSMYRMFYFCSKLTSLDLSNFNTSSVTDMYEMFYSCSSLTTLKLSENFDTSNVTNMSYMFDNCRNLQQVTIGANDSKGIMRQLPTPSSDYIDGADGNWYSSDGTAYKASSIPLSKADTYYASKSLVPSAS